MSLEELINPSIAELTPKQRKTKVRRQAYVRLSNPEVYGHAGSTDGDKSILLAIMPA
jgi:hypothetical protein